MKKHSDLQNRKMTLRRIVIFKVISVGFSLFIGLFLCELMTRVYYFGLDAFSYTKVNSFISIGVSGFLEGADNKKILYELKPNIDSHFKLSTFKTNSQGCRDKEYSISKPDKTIRGLVFGDSYTMGSGVEIENVYHSVMEQALNEQSDSINYEFINFGVGGYNLLNYKGLMEEKAVEYDPDFILIGYCAFNDFFLPPDKHYEGNYKVKIKKSRGTPFYSCYLCGLIERAFASTTTKQMFGIKPKEKAFVDQMFKEYSEFSKANNIPIIISVLAVLGDNGNLAIIQEIATKYKLPITDSYGMIDPTELSAYTISKLDHHPNAKAHKVYADDILDFGPFKELIKNRK
ncbi:MAG: SGNH/GDSL hydrolase family protein [Flavobacteriales bacterium]|nr:SGNH/GDSL hydrolase family protein [Flavobacteriales bacterium]